MFYNLKISFRNLSRNGIYSVVNIVGLAVSLTAAVLILLWVQDVLNRNKCFKNAEQIYQYGSCSFEEDAAFMVENFPEVLSVCRTGNPEIDLGALSCEKGDKFTVTNVYLADSSLFAFFGLKILLGNPDKPFEDKWSIVLTESLAKRLYGEENPVGKWIQSDIYGQFHVTAVMADMPRNSSLKYSALIPMSFYSDWMAWILRDNPKFTNHRHCQFYTYVMLTKNADPKALSIKIKQEEYKVNYAGTREFDPEKDYYSRLESMTDKHLYYYDGNEKQPTGIKRVRLFSNIVAVLLLIAVINYVNLVTARLIKRTKEVEIRKILGGNKTGLFLQMMQETMLMVFIALLFATGLIYGLLPFYNELTGKQLLFDFSVSEVWMTYAGLFLVVSFSAGIYPALKLISFQSTGLGSFHQTMRSRFILRKILIVVQFVFSMIFIIVAIAMNMQLRFMKEKDPGYNKENVFALPLNNMTNHYNAIKQELLQDSNVADITATNTPINRVSWMTGRTWKDENGDDKKVCASILWGDYNILDFFDIPILEGKGFSQDNKPLDGLILNRKAWEQLDFENLIGEPFNWFSDDMRITGKIGDFHFGSLYKEIDALAMMYNPVEINYLYIKTFPGKTQQAIMAVEKIWKRYNDGYPFEYRFIDDDFDELYKSDIQKEKLFNVFAIIAIFVSLLGLFGLITYTAETKTKEIGIRKVYGASVRNIVEMLSKEFLVLVGIAMLIAFPLAYFWLDRMLQDYAYRISVSWWMFALAAAVTVVLTLLTVGVQSLRAATRDPVKAIMSGE